MAVAVLLVINFTGRPRVAPPPPPPPPPVSVPDPGGRELPPAPPTTGTPPASVPATVKDPGDAEPATPASWLRFAGLPKDGKLLREWWLNIPGNFVVNLTSKPAFPDQPTGAELIDSAEGPTNWKDE